MSRAARFFKQFLRTQLKLHAITLSARPTHSMHHPVTPKWANLEIAPMPRVARFCLIFKCACIEEHIIIRCARSDRIQGPRVGGLSGYNPVWHFAPISIRAISGTRSTLPFRSGLSRGPRRQAILCVYRGGKEAKKSKS